MNLKQRIVLISVLFIIALMILIPPFQWKSQSLSVNVGYGFVFGEMNDMYQINFIRLLIQLLAVLTIGGVIFFILKETCEIILFFY